MEIKQLLNMKNLIGNIRDFNVYYENNNHEFIKKIVNKI